MSNLLYNKEIDMFMCDRTWRKNRATSYQKGSMKRAMQRQIDRGFDPDVLVWLSSFDERTPLTPKGED